MIFLWNILQNTLGFSYLVIHRNSSLHILVNLQCHPIYFCLDGDDFFCMDCSPKHFGIFLFKDSQKMPSSHISISPVPSYLFLLILRWFFSMDWSSKHFGIFLFKDPILFNSYWDDFFTEYSSKQFRIFLFKDLQTLLSSHICKSPMLFQSFLTQIEMIFLWNIFQNILGFS